MEINRLLKNVKTSPTMLLNQRAKQLVREGKSILNLTTGELDFATPERIKNAAIKAIQNNFTYYTETAGIPELRKAIAHCTNQTYGSDYDMSNVMVCSGAKQAIFNALFALLNPLDEVVLIAPYWGSYNEAALMCGATVRVVTTTMYDDYIPKVEDIAAVLSSKTKILILNSPNNPTGAVYPQSFFSKLSSLLADYPHIYVISDDIYEKILFSDAHFTSIGKEDTFPKEKLIIVHGASKTYSMTGWRIGWAITSPELVKFMTTIQSQVTSNPTSFAQVAAVEALEGPQLETDVFMKALDERRATIFPKLQAIAGLRVFYPKGAFYFFMDVGHFLKKQSDVELCTTLLEKYHLACVPGSAFGAPGHLRITFAASLETLNQAADVLCKALTEIEGTNEQR